jgi:hypothetical protein
VGGGLLVALGLSVAAEKKERVSCGCANERERTTGLLLRLLGLVAEGVNASRGAVAERVVRVLSDVLCRRRKRGKKKVRQDARRVSEKSASSKVGTTQVGTKDALLASFEAPAVYCWTVSATSAGRKQD